MVTDAMAYVEVLEMLKHLPLDEYNKIPKEKIQFFEENKDKNYKFSIVDTKNILNNNISQKAFTIMVVLYNDYFFDRG